MYICGCGFVRLFVNLVVCGYCCFVVLSLWMLLCYDCLVCWVALGAGVSG